MRWQALKLAVVVWGVCLGNAAWAEVPNKSKDQLTSEASIVVTGPVVKQYESRAGRETSYITVIRAEKVVKGDVKLGEEIEVRWSRRIMRPMETGSSGHRGDRVGLGHVLTVYQKAGTVIFPNGFEPAEPLHVSKALLESGDGGALSGAGKKAAAAKCFEEAAMAWKAALDVREDAADRIEYAGALWAQGLTKDATAAARPLAVMPLPKPEPSEKPKMAKWWATSVGRARLLLLDEAWDRADRKAYAALMVEFGRVDQSEETWRWVQTTAEWLENAEAEKVARAALMKMGVEVEGGRGGVSK